MVGTNTTTTDHAHTPRKALLIRNAAAYDFGGAERFVVYLAEQLGQNGWEAIVVSAHAKIKTLASERHVAYVKGWWWSRQDWHGWRTALTPLYLLWQTVLCVWYIQLILRLKPDVVHPQSKDDFIAATLAARLLKKRIIWTDHADLKYIYRNVRVPFKNPIGKLVRWYSRYASAITAVSKSERQLIGTALGASPPKTYQVIYNGIVDHAVAPYKRAPGDVGAFIFCATSRLVTAKGIGELIKAFKRTAKDKNMRLWLLGEGPEEAAFKRLAEGDPHIVFWGFPANSLSMVKSADVFVHPSYHEGFSLSIIEASMLQKPIIACNVGGNPEIITDNETGLLVPPKDAIFLSIAMQKLAEDTALRTRLASAARTNYEHNYRFDVIVKNNFIPVYEKR